MSESFSYELTSERSPKTVLHAALASFTDPLSDCGYRLTTQSEAAVTYERTYRPWNVWLGGLLLVPVLIGIPILVTQARTSTITILIEERQSDTRVLIRGTGPRRVREAFEGLQL